MFITRPTDIASPPCVIWLDAAATTTLSSFSAVNVSPANNRTGSALQIGDRIGFWGNRVSNQFNFLNSFGLTGNRPIYYPSISAVEFISQDQTYLTADYNSTFTAGAQTVFVVALSEDGVIGFRIFTQNNTGVNDDAGVIPVIQSNNNGDIGTWQGGGYQATNATTRAKGKFFVACYNNTGTQIQNSIDINTPTTFNVTIGNQAVNRMRLGARLRSDGRINDGTQVLSNYDGFIREVIVYNGSLSVSQRSSVLGYLSGKWNVPFHQQNAIYALSSGDWDSILWSTSGLPNPEKDIVYSNSFNVVISRSLSANVITNRFGSGAFLLNSGVSLSANLLWGGSTTYCIQHSLPAPSIVSVIAPLSTASIFGGIITNNSTGTLNYRGHYLGAANVNSGGILINNNNVNGVVSISGTLQGGPQSNSVGIRNIGFLSMVGSLTGGVGFASYGADNTGTLLINGSIQGGNNSNQGHGVNMNTSSVIFVTGSVIGPAVGNSSGTTHGINSGTISSINVNGIVVGGAGGSASAPTAGIGNGNPGFINVIGAVMGGPGDSSHGISNTNIGTVSVTGSVFGGNSLANSCGITNSNFGTVTVYGVVSGGRATSSRGVFNSSSGFVYLSGISQGGTASDANGILNTSTGVCIVVGEAVGGLGSNVPGAVNTGLGSLNVTKAVGNSWGRGVVGGLPDSPIGASVGLRSDNIFGLVTAEALQTGPRGVWPTGGGIYIDHTGNSTLCARMFVHDTIFGAPSSRFFFTTKLVVGGLTFVPSPSDVRLGITYDFNTKIGTCILPIPEVVLATEPLDDGFGKAKLDSDLIWQVLYNTISAFPEDTIGRRLIRTINMDKAGELRTQLE